MFWLIERNAVPTIEYRIPAEDHLDIGLRVSNKISNIIKWRKAVYLRNTAAYDLADLLAEPCFDMHDKDFETNTYTVIDWCRFCKDNGTFGC